MPIVLEGLRVRAENPFKEPMIPNVRGRYRECDHEESCKLSEFMEDLEHVLLALGPNSHRDPLDVQNIVKEELRNLVKCQN